jgi:hypothetical protein
MGNSLFNITAEQKLLMLEIESLEGEITPEIEERLAITESQLQQKSIAYLEVIRQKEAYNGLIDAEIKRLQGLKKQTNNVIERLEETLLNAVKTFGVYTVGTQKFGTRKSSQIIVEDVNSLPEKFKVIKVTEQADKMALKEALKNGEKIEGVYVQDNLNLKIN